METPTLLFNDYDDHSAVYYFNPGLFETERRGVVYPSNRMSSDAIYIRTASASPWYGTPVSVVICTYGRPESLNETIKSLCAQSFKSFEIVLVTEKGHLSELRDKGLRSASGDIVSLIDDDVYCPPTWLKSVVNGFRKGVVGVSGPTVITKEFERNRDTFKFSRIRRMVDWFFGVPHKPGHLSSSGAPSMESNMEGCAYEGPVEYLECCNMSVLRTEAINAGGFDHNYILTSEWCEVDLALRLGKRGRLMFERKCGLYHRPSKAGVYKARLHTVHRWKNFTYFQRKWIKKSLRRYLYWAFVWIYLNLKEHRMI